MQNAATLAGTDDGRAHAADPVTEMLGKLIVDEKMRQAVPKKSAKAMGICAKYAGKGKEKDHDIDPTVEGLMTTIGNQLKSIKDNIQQICVFDNRAYVRTCSEEVELPESGLNVTSGCSQAVNAELSRIDGKFADLKRQRNSLYPETGMLCFKKRAQTCAAADPAQVSKFLQELQELLTMLTDAIESANSSFKITYTPQITFDDEVRNILAALEEIRKASESLKMILTRENAAGVVKYHAELFAKVGVSLFGGKLPEGLTLMQQEANKPQPDQGSIYNLAHASAHPTGLRALKARLFRDPEVDKFYKLVEKALSSDEGQSQANKPSPN